jgi:hypothetical protein
MVAGKIRESSHTGECERVPEQLNSSSSSVVTSRAAQPRALVVPPRRQRYGRGNFYPPAAVPYPTAANYLVGHKLASQECLLVNGCTIEGNLFVM